MAPRAAQRAEQAIGEQQRRSGARFAAARLHAPRGQRRSEVAPVPPRQRARALRARGSARGVAVHREHIVAGRMLRGSCKAPHARALGCSRVRGRGRCSAARAAQTPHEVLGVPVGVSAVELKAAFRARVRAIPVARRGESAPADDSHSTQRSSSASTPT